MAECGTKAPGVVKGYTDLKWEEWSAIIEIYQLIIVSHRYRPCIRSLVFECSYAAMGLQRVEPDGKNLKNK